jgi:hypothetical protein
MLEASLAYYQAFLEERKDDPTIGAELDAARVRVSTILAELSAFDVFFRLQSQLWLLSEDAVRDDLKLSAEQAEKVRDLAETYKPRGPGGGFAEMRQMTPEQKRERFSKMAGEIQQTLAAVLTSAQVSRLQQVHRQRRGPFAFSDADVVDALALTTEQKDRIRAIQAQARDARFGHPFNDRPASERKDWVAMILAKLTPEQTAIWKTLTGEPAPLRDMRPGPWRGPEPPRDERDRGPNK